MELNEKEWYEEDHFTFCLEEIAAARLKLSQAREEVKKNQHTIFYKESLARKEKQLEKYRYMFHRPMSLSDQPFTQKELTNQKGEEQKQRWTLEQRCDVESATFQQIKRHLKRTKAIRKHMERYNEALRLLPLKEQLSKNLSNLENELITAYRTLTKIKQNYKQINKRVKQDTQRVCKCGFEKNEQKIEEAKFVISRCMQDEDELNERCSEMNEKIIEIENHPLLKRMYHCIRKTKKKLKMKQESILEEIKTSNWQMKPWETWVTYYQIDNMKDKQFLKKIKEDTEIKGSLQEIKTELKQWDEHLAKELRPFVQEKLKQLQEQLDDTILLYIQLKEMAKEKLSKIEGNLSKTEEDVEVNLRKKQVSVIDRVRQIKQEDKKKQKGNRFLKKSSMLNERML